jgi:TPR repeat protein
VVRGIIFLSFVLLAQGAAAFEGDYIWDERFKTGLSKAASGKAKDQYALGVMYLKGRGTHRDPAEALSWFLKAAKQGHTRAAYKAGKLLLQGGEGVESSPKRAVRLLTYSAESGYIPAQYMLGKAYATGEAGKRDMPQALQWLGKAKLNGYPKADEAVQELIHKLVAAQGSSKH